MPLLHSVALLLRAASTDWSHSSQPTVTSAYSQNFTSTYGQNSTSTYNQNSTLICSQSCTMPLPSSPQIITSTYSQNSTVLLSSSQPTVTSTYSQNSTVPLSLNQPIVTSTYSQNSTVPLLSSQPTVTSTYSQNSTVPLSSSQPTVTSTYSQNSTIPLSSSQPTATSTYSQPTITSTYSQNSTVPLSLNQPTVTSTYSQNSTVLLSSSQPTITSIYSQNSTIPLSSSQPTVTSTYSQNSTVPLSLSQPTVTSTYSQNSTIPLSSSQPTATSTYSQNSTVLLSSSQPTATSTYSQPTITSTYSQNSTIPLSSSQPTVTSTSQNSTVPLSLNQPTVTSTYSQNSTVPLSSSQPTITSTSQNSTVPLSSSQPTVTSTYSQNSTIPLSSSQPTVTSTSQNSTVPLSSSQPTATSTYSQPTITSTYSQNSTVPLSSSQPTVTSTYSQPTITSTYSQNSTIPLSSSQPTVTSTSQNSTVPLSLNQPTITSTYSQNSTTLVPTQDSTATVISSQPTSSAQPSGLTVADCSFYSSSGIHPECWEILKMTDHLNDWWSKNANKCTDKSFAQCYLDIAGYITWTCDIISLNTCPPPPSGANAGYISYHEFYVFWNIYSINQFFSLYHQALLNGQAGAIGTVAEIVKIVAPPITKNPHTPLVGPIFAAATGLFFGVVGGIGAISGALATWGILSAESGTLIGATMGGGAAFVGPLPGFTPGLINLLFPKSSVDPVSWQDLSAALSKNVDDFQVAVGNTLKGIQTDFNVFSEVTANGTFSHKIATSLPDDTSFMYHNLLKWTFNQALQAKGYFIVKNTGVDPRKVPVGDFSCKSLDKYNTCGVIWYDGTADSYGLARANDIGMDEMEAILQIAFSRNWTTPSELYIDAQLCRGKNGSEAFDATRLSLICTSNTPVCEFEQDYNPYEIYGSPNNPPEFKNCPTQPGFGVPYWGGKAGVPLAYLGPFLMTGVKYKGES